eukprot:TRINITY_DN2381_c1_g1_i2.p2 TRINITY_DN2381_c1_g1~~TRINITY_DN2381_c1_g1_i2.p2  ORF type:complete len:105 (-),score=5.03 TRINITY_DN2381_c1_g1_i2:24-305(-)
MYPYLALEMIDKEDVDQFWIRAIRYRLQIPRFVDNKSVNHLLGIIPSIKLQERAVKEGYRKNVDSEKNICIKRSTSSKSLSLHQYAATRKSWM